MSVSRTALVGLLASVIFGGCGGGPAPETTVLPPRPQMVQVTASEYRFHHVSHVTKGRVVIRMENAGTRSHQLVLVELPADIKGSLDDQLHSGERRPVHSVQIMPAVASNKQGVFAVDLPAGRYGFICFLTDSDGMSHALKGMNSELRVR